MVNIKVNKQKTGKKIRELRVKRNLKINEISKILGFRGYLFYEKGILKPRLIHLLQLSKIYNVKLDDLLSYQVDV